MKVNQLIEILKNCDPEAIVEIIANDGIRIFQIVSVTETKWHYNKIESGGLDSKVKIKSGD